MSALAMRAPGRAALPRPATPGAASGRRPTATELKALAALAVGCTLGHVAGLGWALRDPAGVLLRIVAPHHLVELVRAGWLDLLAGDEEGQAALTAGGRAAIVRGADNLGRRRPLRSRPTKGACP